MRSGVVAIQFQNAALILKCLFILPGSGKEQPTPVIALQELGIQTDRP